MRKRGNFHDGNRNGLKKMTLPSRAGIALVFIIFIIIIIIIH